MEVDPAALGLTAKGADADDWCPEDPIDELLVALKPYAPPPVLESAAPTTTTQRIVIKGGKMRDGLLAALDHLVIDLRYDERSARVQFLDATADFPKWTNSDDMYRAELRERIADKFLYVTKDGKAPLAFSKDRFSDVIDALLNSRRIDPFKAWLDALPEWDGEKRLDFWISHCFEIRDMNDELLRWASCSVLMGAVARDLRTRRETRRNGDSRRPTGAREVNGLGVAAAARQPARVVFRCLEVSHRPENAS